MKILYIVSTLRACGPINQLFYLCKHLDRQYYKPTILTLSAEPSNSTFNNFQEIDIPIHSLALSRLEGFFIGGNKLKSFVKKYSPDIIHSHGLRADLLSAQYLSGYKRVATIHSYPYDDYVMKYGQLMGTYSAWQHFRAWRRIDLPVACSETIGARVRELDINPVIIRNGVDENLYVPASSKERLQLRQKLSLPSDQKIFVSVGSLIRVKQPDTIVRGFLSSQAKQNSILLMIGDGTLSDSCKAIANKTSNIRFLGQVNNVVDYLKTADYFISASVSEGLPNSVMEALSCGVPVCLSDIKPHKEILSLNQQAGIIFSVGNIESLATQLDKLINAQTDLMSIAARSIIEENLQAKKMSANYQNLYAVKDQ